MTCFRSLGLSVAALFSATAWCQPAYDWSRIEHERLNRGLVVVSDSHSDSVVVSWRLLRDDPEGTSFNVVLNGTVLNDTVLTQSTFMRFPSARLLEGDNQIQVCRLADGDGVVETVTCSVSKQQLRPYLAIPLQRPDGGICPDGSRFDYSANDASVGDVDGDGTYEIILKWEPSNARDNSHNGYTGAVIFDCYKLDGTRLWRIDLGPNIRAGAHYTQFLVYDFDHDGRAEVMMKTADGTQDGVGRCLGDSTADYRSASGRILQGPEYLTVFDGLTGQALQTVDYVPARGNPQDWGDSYGNRCDRFLACVAYLDGIHASAVFCRGYYTRSVLAAWRWDGRQLTQQWVFDTDSDGLRAYAGQGNHNLRVADVDGDGCDEITYGAMAVDHDGSPLYLTGMGHGDALHLMAFYPDSTKLQVWDVHENRRDGSELRDAATGRVIFQIPSSRDVGRGMAADIDPTHPGVEMWSSDSHGIRDVQGRVINGQDSRVAIPINFAVWWDGDLLRELLDRAAVFKYDWQQQQCRELVNFSDECAFNNGTKSNPCLSADILGDWREEIVMRTHDSSQLRIYTTDIPTSHRMPTLMQDIPYRLSVAAENVGYNQPPEVGFYLGEH